MSFGEAPTDHPVDDAWFAHAVAAARTHDRLSMGRDLGLGLGFPDAEGPNTAGLSVRSDGTLLKTLSRPVGMPNRARNWLNEALFYAQIRKHLPETDVTIPALRGLRVISRTQVQLHLQYVTGAVPFFGLQDRLRRGIDKGPRLQALYETGRGAVCHGDAHGQNVLAQGDRTFLLIDWATVRYGTIGDDLPLLIYPWLLRTLGPGSAEALAALEERCLEAYQEGIASRLPGQDRGTVRRAYRIKAVGHAFRTSRTLGDWLRASETPGQYRQRADILRAYYTVMGLHAAALTRSAARRLIAALRPAGARLGGMIGRG
ncbi:phosphotransferase [Pseudoroseicyclus aestuarii]|uniref:Phosphotransferase family enzyme n=1 Tax=Pseudoroseicyclus aestuarii TaxID=1795041 RepID=A0A318SSR8_9RHOB|nr:phosphotransferase [Pseudoroseicyclus aestuarii]PYE82179.1 phosphotransferase family enzyme [Pseudoroseicyclus aestuarii]